jgi:hypothetical protein
MTPEVRKDGGASCGGRSAGRNRLRRRYGDVVDAESYLLILGERRAIAWVLREQRMAFPRTARAEVDRLAAGDELFIYTTRGAFNNPTRDRGRVVGRAVVTSVVTEFDEPVEISGREFPRGCEIRVETLAPWRSGVDLAAFVEQLEAFPNPKAWSIYLRRPLLRLPPADARLLDHRLKPLVGSLNDNIQGYLDRADFDPAR